MRYLKQKEEDREGVVDEEAVGEEAADEEADQALGFVVLVLEERGVGEEAGVEFLLLEEEKEV